METKKNYSENFDDLIFFGRNKSYGAYNLRSKYSNILFISLAITFFVAASIICVPLINSYFYKPIVELVKPDIDITLSTVKFDEPKIELPKIDVPKSLISNIVFRQPLVVDEVNEVEEKLVDAKLLDDNEVGNKGLDIEYIPQTTNIVEDNTEYTTVEENARFENGDLSLFTKWLIKNIKYSDDILDAGINGRMIVKFVVDKNGKITNVEFIRPLHTMLDNQIKNLLLNCPDWTPAKQNGNTVKQLYYLPIVFKIEG